MDSPILDGSHTLFSTGNPLSTSTGGKEKKIAQSIPSSKSSRGQNEGGTLGLHAIPGFAEIVLDAIRDVTSTGPLGKVALIDVGVGCDGTAVRALGRAIHDRVGARLKVRLFLVVVRALCCFGSCCSCYMLVYLSSHTYQEYQ